MLRKGRNYAALGVLTLAALKGGGAHAQATASPAAGQTQGKHGRGVEEIVVTAEKREQRISRVGQTVTAISGIALARQGVTDVTQLPKVVPGLTYFTSTNGTPVYSLRGVGFNDSSLGSYPTTSVYVDEVPLPFSAVTTEAGMDIACVEVLKGPQGTLFGQNSTAGAINYVSAAPSTHLTAGGDLTYSRFNTVQGSGFVSGPLTSTLDARLSVDATHGDGWQQSYTRPDDTLGSVEREAGRLLMRWQPNSDLTVRLNINGWVDRSQPTAAQLVAITPEIPVLIYPELENYPRLPAPNARLADWSPNWGIKADDSFVQGSLRADYTLDAIKLTSITSVSDYNRDERGDRDGMALAETNYANAGGIRSFFQELRATNASTSRLRWILGANFSKDKVADDQNFSFGDETTARASGFGNANFFSDQNMTNYAFFGDAEFDVTNKLTVKGGVRFTQADRTLATCSSDDGDGAAARFFTAIAQAFNPAAPVIPPGHCFTLDPKTLTASLYQASLNENNVSWRLGADYKLSPDILLYFNAAKGYKAGGFPTVIASFITQFVPVKQESVLDFEGGTKIRALDNRLSIDAAMFHYGYNNKQIRGDIIDPIFGPLEALQNVPRSEILGAEAAVAASPIDGLTVGVSGTWLQSQIDRFTGVNGGGLLGNYAGSPIPYTPKWQIAANFDYETAISDAYSAFVGANVIHHSSTYSSIGTADIPGGTGTDLNLALDAYTTLDLRAGIETRDRRWRLTLWGRNVTNDYYWNNVVKQSDVVVRYAALPATYGVTLSFRYQ